MNNEKKSGDKVKNPHSTMRKLICSENMMGDRFKLFFSIALFCISLLLLWMALLMDRSGSFCCGIPVFQAWFSVVCSFIGSIVLFFTYKRK